MHNGRNQKGFNAVEMMVAVALVAIFATVGVPSFYEFIQTKRLQSLAETIASDIKEARSESISHRKILFVSFKPGANWCYGLDDVASCDCSVANDCQVDGVEKVISSADYSNTNITVSGLSGTSGNEFIEFEGLRGVVETTGSLVASLNGKTITISITKLGMVNHCSDDLKEFPACP